MTVIRFALFLLLCLAACAAGAQQRNPELDQATIEITAGQSLYQLGQMRAQVVQLKQQIEDLKKKCGEPCNDNPGQGK